MDELGNLIGEAGVWHIVVVLVALWAIEMRASVRVARKRPRRLHHPAPGARLAATTRKSGVRGH